MWTKNFIMIFCDIYCDDDIDDNLKNTIFQMGN